MRAVILLLHPLSGRSFTDKAICGSSMGIGYDSRSVNHFWHVQIHLGQHTKSVVVTIERDTRAHSPVAHNGACIVFCAMNGRIHIIQALAAALAQGYFVYRIYVFSGKNLVLPLIWAILGCCQLGGTILYICKALYFSHGVYVVKVSMLGDIFFTTLATSTLSIGAGVDILIAISLTYLLLRKRTASGFASTTHILQRLIFFSVNTGSWTALFSLLTIILMHGFPTEMIYVVCGIPLCSVYCNTVLANLNARHYIRRETIGHNVDTEQVPMTGSRGTEVIMIGTDRQKEKKMSISSAPSRQRNAVSWTDGIRAEMSENAV